MRDRSARLKTKGGSTTRSSIVGAGAGRTFRPGRRNRKKVDKTNEKTEQKDAKLAG